MTNIEETTTHDAKDIAGYYPTLAEFFSADLPASEEIFSGVYRGEVAAIEAVTNIGKSTLLLNLCLSLAAGVRCIPLAPYESRPRRVLYIDAESPASLLRDDLRIMLGQIDNAPTAKTNFCLLVDPLIAEEPLNLKRQEHLNYVAAIAQECKADLIVLDTVTACFDLHEENSNSEVTRIMKNLRELARKSGCAVVYTHHIGKYAETGTSEGSYKGRGASAFGGQSRTILLLEKDAQRGEGYAVLRCAKNKRSGVGRIKPTLLKLNEATRFFEVCAEQPSAPKTATTQDIAAFVKGCESGASSDDICKHFADRESKRTIQTRIKSAASDGLITKPSRRANWIAVEIEVKEKEAA
jgi:hypothetical protein